MNRIEKNPFIVQDDGKDLKVLAPIQVSSVDSITLDTISYTENSSTQLAGRARLAYSVRIYLNNKLEGEVKVSESGAWKAALSDVQAGVYTLRLDEVSENGKVEGRLELPFKREEEALIQAMGREALLFNQEIVCGGSRENIMGRAYNMSKYLREIHISLGIQT